MLPSLFSLFSLSAQVQIASDASPASLSFHDDAHNEVGRMTGSVGAINATTRMFAPDMVTEIGVSLNDLGRRLEGVESSSGSQAELQYIRESLDNQTAAIAQLQASLNIVLGRMLPPPPATPPPPVPPSAPPTPAPWDGATFCNTAYDSSWSCGKSLTDQGWHVLGNFCPQGDTAYDRFNTGCNGMPSTGSSYSWMMYSNGGSPQQGAAMGGFMTMQSWANHGSGIRLAYSGVWSPTGIQCNGAGAFELVIALGNAYPNGASEPNYVSVAATNGCPSGNIGGGTYVAGQSGVQPYVQHCPVVTSGTPFYVQAGCGACRIYIAYVICRPLSPPSSPPPGLCTNTCEYASDGMCQDGSTGSVSVACALGTDCEDCGNRLP